MTTVTQAPPAGDLAVRLWRHHDPDAADVPGVGMGTVTVPGDPAVAAADLVARGARRAVLCEPVDLAAPASPVAAVRALVLVRELTSRAVVVGWRLRLGPDLPWHLLSHLYPPTELAGAGGDDLREWQGIFYLCRLVYRQGPGFVQVRDRRAGDLNCLTIDEPDYLAAVEVLRDGAPVSAVPGEILAAFAAEELVGVVGDLAWWMPYRVRHWPWPVMNV